MLVAADTEETPWPMVVDLVQDGNITLAAQPNDRLPAAWAGLAEVHVTCLGRYSVYLIHVPVVRSSTTELVVRAPDGDTAVQRRAYARVLRHVPVSCAALDTDANAWTDVRRRGAGSRRWRLLDPH